ncbi:hypothetical protein GCM10022287_22200 [Gryllotalpicola koreensis]|uniref:Uncharacterized protein n=1 Tax=Gryllotalpicola koreensis TaxID=993086 RepID=A0ABP8A2B3_9MICO
MIACVTNELLDIRSCTVKDQHLDSCDGFEYRWRDVWNPQLKRDVPVRFYTGRECTGCLPREASNGLLCWHCFEKWREALSVAKDMITHLRSVERAQQVDNQGIRASSSWVLPIPTSWRTADELLTLLSGAHFASTDSIDDVVSITTDIVDSIDPELFVTAEQGAENAVRFYRLTQKAMASHPMKEYEHRVRNVRCYKCRQRTLLWKPPLQFMDDIHVVCQNPDCGAVVDQTLFERLAVLEEAKPSA